MSEGTATAVVFEEHEVPEGSLRRRARGEPGADLIVLYTAEESGSLDTCGCAVRPRGSWARLATWRDATARWGGAPVVLVDVGGWLADAVSSGVDLPGAAQDDAYMVRGARLVGFDALNVGVSEVDYLDAHGGGDLPLVGRAWGERRLRVGEIDLQIVGVAGRGARIGFPPVADEGPILLVLAHDIDGDAAALVREVPGVDLLVEADQFVEGSGNLGDADTVWVRAPADGMRVGELRLWVVDGRIVRVVRREVDLDASIPSRADLARLRDNQRARR